MTLETWLIFVAVSIAPAISPGPAVVLAVSNSIRFTPRATLWSASGNAVGLLIVGVAVTFGMGSVMTASATAFTVVKLTGAAYLVYLGIRMWRGQGWRSPSEPGHAGNASPGRLFAEALLVAVTNPKAIFILIALLPQFLEPENPVLPQALLLSLTYSALCFINHMLVGVFACHVGRFLTSPRGTWIFRRAVGATFIGFGAAIAAAPRP